MRGLIYILLFLPVFAHTQSIRDPYAIANPAGDTPGVVKQGVIKVRKPSIRPYFKCEYYLTLSRVQEVQIEVASPSGFGVEMDKVPVFDSTIYSERYARVFPEKDINFSRLLVDEVDFAYSFDDTASIDTMVVEMWITKTGKIKWRNVDTTNGSTMPRTLELELFQSVNNMTDWGKGGGYLEPKKFLRKQKRQGESYYCVLYIIASAKPLTQQQKQTGMRYCPIDVPLNAPPAGEPLKEGKQHAPEGDTISGDRRK